MGKGKKKQKGYKNQDNKRNDSCGKNGKKKKEMDK